MGLNHESRVILVKVDADIGVADLVEELNEIEGVRTFSSCQGTIGEGGPHPYRAYVGCTWTPEGRRRLEEKFIVQPYGNGTWGYVHPKSTAGLPDGAFEVAVIHEQKVGG